MKEYTEKIIPLPYGGDPELMVAEIDKSAKELYDQGWYYIESKTDELLSNITLFFERDIDTP